MFLNRLNKLFNFLFKDTNITDNIEILTSNTNIFFNKKNNLISFFSYQNPLVKDIIYKFKFNKKHRFATLFGDILYENLPEILEELRIQKNFNSPILIPIPISFWRKVSRGYNQNELIIKSFSKLGGDNFIKIEKNVLKKIKNTKPQSKMKNRKERFENVKNCFKVINKDIIKGRNIILFDDIKTTGATLEEAKKELQKVGVKKVIFLTIAN